MTATNPGNNPARPLYDGVELAPVVPLFPAPELDPEVVDLSNEDFADGGLTGNPLWETPPALVEPTGIADEDISFRNFPERLGNTGRTFGAEISEKGHRGKRIGAFVVAATTQAFDRGRAMVFVLPTVFDRVLTHGVEHDWNGYQTAGAAALAVGGTFAAWGYAVGKSFHYSLNQYPTTTERVVENHPAMVGAISRAIDGFPTEEQMTENHPVKPEQGYDVAPYEARKSKLGKVVLGLKRGPKTALLFGTTAHVGMAKVNGHSDESNEKRRRVVTAEAAASLGALAAGLSTLITHDSLGLAEDIKEAVTNKTYLGIATAVAIGWGIVGNYAARRKEKKEFKAKAAQEAVALEPQVA